MEENQTQNIAFVYQTKKQIHDLALTAKEKNSYVKNNHKFFPCARFSSASIPVAKLVQGNIKLSTDTLKLQLLVREKIAQRSIEEVQRCIEDFQIAFTLEEYMRMLGYSDDEILNFDRRANVMRNINNALQLLQNTMFMIKTGRNYYRFCLFPFVCKTDTMFSLRVSKEYVSAILLACKVDKRGNICPLLTRFSKQIYTLGSTNSILVLYYLETRYSMQTNRNNKVHNRISIGKLAEFLTLPKTKAEVKRRGSTNYYREMVKPVITALDDLSERGLITYSLQNSGDNAPLAKLRIREYRRNPEAFLKLMVHFTCHGLNDDFHQLP